jgi:hypothetical protein
MWLRIVKFYFQKIDGTISSNLVPAIAGTDTRKKNDMVQPYFGTEKQEWPVSKKPIY